MIVYLKLEQVDKPGKDVLAIDLESLNQQKAWLEVQEDDDEPWAAGLLGLLDSIQDIMVDELKVPERDVFPRLFGAAK